MKLGKICNSGDIILADIQFTDTFEIKRRPALVLFSEYGNVVVVGITSNVSMKGIPLTQEQGAVKDSVIKLNYIFTISEIMVEKVLFHLDSKTKQLVYNALTKKLKSLE